MQPYLVFLFCSVVVSEVLCCVDVSLLPVLFGTLCRHCKDRPTYFPTICHKRQLNQFCLQKLVSEMFFYVK